MSGHVVYIAGVGVNAREMYELSCTDIHFCDASLASIDLLESWDLIHSLESKMKITQKDIEDIRDAIIKMARIPFPEAKVLCTKPYQSKITKSKYAGNNFKRSGFQTSGKLARGRI